MSAAHIYKRVCHFLLYCNIIRTSTSIYIARLSVGVNCVYIQVLINFSHPLVVLGGAVCIHVVVYNSIFSLKVYVAPQLVKILC